MDIKTIKNNKDSYIQNQIKRYLPTEPIESLIMNYELLNESNLQCNGLRSLVTKVSKRIALLVKQGKERKEEKEKKEDKEDNQVTAKTLDVSELTLEFLESLNKDPDSLISYNTESLKQISVECGSHIKNILLKNAEITKELTKEYIKLPNLVHESVIVSDNEDNNAIICTNHEENLAMRNVVINTVKPGYTSLNLSHVVLLDRLGFIDTDIGIKVAGNRGYFLKGMGVKFNMALLNYALDFLEARGFTPMETPEVMTHEAISQVCQLSEFTETLYTLEGSDKYLIATSEQPITASFKDTVIEPKDVPVKIAGLSSCFRKETGKHGSDTLGIFRVHQFKKVEQFCVTRPEDSWKMFDEMINNSKEFNDSLGLSYRVVNIVSGALNNAAAMKYDLEAYFPSSGNYHELVSCSNCLDYFSKRIGTKLGFGEQRCIPHMLNATLCANTRTICCIVESYQTSEGIVVPEILRSYLGDVDFIPFKK